MVGGMYNSGGHRYILTNKSHCWSQEPCQYTTPKYVSQANTGTASHSTAHHTLYTEEFRPVLSKTGV